MQPKARNKNESLLLSIGHHIPTFLALVWQLQLVIPNLDLWMSSSAGEFPFHALSLAFQGVCVGINMYICMYIFLSQSIKKCKERPREAIKLHVCDEHALPPSPSVLDANPSICSTDRASPMEGDHSFCFWRMLFRKENIHHYLIIFSRWPLENNILLFSHCQYYLYLLNLSLSLSLYLSVNV